MTNYRGFRDACVGLFFPALHFGKYLFYYLNRIKLRKVGKNSRIFLCTFCCNSAFKCLSTHRKGRSNTYRIVCERSGHL